MAHVKYLVRPMEWAKHLRPWGKRRFWKRVRKMGKRVIITERVAPASGDDHAKQSIPPAQSPQQNVAQAQGRSQPAL